MIRILVCALCCLLLASCAHEEKIWHRTDGRLLDDARLDLDKTICRGETAKVDALSDAGAMRRIRAADDVMVGCMAQRGYVAERR